MAADRDLDLMQARALHRLVRAMNDGECPKCHRLHPRPLMRFAGDATDVGLFCSACKFTIHPEEVRAILAMFAPAMDAAVEVLDRWRATRP